jgi:hypothetical protein
MVVAECARLFTDLATLAEFHGRIIIEIGI